MDEKLLALGKAIAEAAGPRPAHIRAGQQVFNVVYAHLPEEANELRGGMVDPFYKDHRIPLFWTAVVDLITKGRKTLKEEDICPSCGNELEWDMTEDVMFCINDWEHG